MKRVLPPFSAVRAFEAAARHLSFKAAAEELCVTQSAVSHQVKSLEDFLGSPLFHRQANTVALTDTGQDYFEDLHSILDHLDDSTRRNRDCETGRALHVHSTPAFATRWLLKNMEAFCSSHPDIELRLTTGIETTNFQTQDVDLLIQYGQRSADGLRTDPFLATTRVPVCSPKLITDAGAVRSPDDLLSYPLLRDDVGDEWHDWFRLAGVDVPEDLHGPVFAHCDLSLSAAEEGLGVALAYEAFIREQVADGRLIRLCRTSTRPKVIYSVTCPQGWERRRKIAAFRSWLFDATAPLATTAKAKPVAADSDGYLPAVPFPN